MSAILSREVKGKGIVSEGTRPPNPLVKWTSCGWLGFEGVDMSRYTRLILGLLMAATCCAAAQAGRFHRVLIRDVATVEGVRDNSLIGYGLVVGLKGTGDRQQTYFTVQTLASILGSDGCTDSHCIREGEQCGRGFCNRESSLSFSRPGMHLDVMVSSSGDARSLEGGLLLLTLALCGRRAGFCGGTRAAGGRRVHDRYRHELTADEPSYRRARAGWKALVERDSALESRRPRSVVSTAERRELPRLRRMLPPSLTANGRASVLKSSIVDVSRSSCP